MNKLEDASPSINDIQELCDLYNSVLSPDVAAMMIGHLLDMTLRK